MGKIKVLTKSQKIDFIFSVITQIYFFFPWIQDGKKSYGTIGYLIRSFEMDNYIEIYKKTFLKGIEDMPDTLGVIALWFWIALITLLVIQIIELLQVFVSTKGTRWGYVQIIGWIVVMIICGVMATMGMTGFTIAGGKPMPIVPNYVYLYLLLFLVIEGVWIIAKKASEEWDEASRCLKVAREEKKAYKRERKKRLNFPGKYSKLYYLVLWKAFLHRWRDFSFLFISVFLSALFLFMGISLGSIFANSYGEDQGMLGLGLVEIMWDFLVVILLISLFLITVVFVFYRKKRMTDTGIFQTMGIRSDASFASWMSELFVGFIAAIACGVVIGRIFLMLFCLVMERVFPVLGSLGKPAGGSYLGTVLGMTFICLFAFGFSHDIQAERQSADSRGASVRSEKMPGKYRYLGLGIGLTLAVYCIYRYAQRRTAESILVLSVFLICLYVVVYNAGGIYLKSRKTKIEDYLQTLPDRHIIFHRYQTTARYVSLLAVIHISVLFFFCMKLVSNQIATEPEVLFPYDYVLLANSGDSKFVSEFVEKCNGKSIEFPMVRATSMDNTEMPDPPRKIIYQQGQNIGISEATYRELKWLVGERPKQDLGLDDAGEKIYIVYQQDQGAKAKPIDWYMGTKEPYLHIGQPLMEFNTFEYRNYYPQRMISGEETSSLIGSFRQGKYENLIVFSDAYFEQVKDNWKTLDMYTGDSLEDEEGVQEGSIYEGPTVLTLIQISDQHREQADKLMIEFQVKHAYDESFDPLVKSAYAKSEEVKRRQMEHLLEMTCNGFVMIILLVVSILLLHIKVQMELPEMQRRYRFMECFGMRQRERVKAEKKEISRFVIMPLALTIFIVPIFTWIVFNLRGFQPEDILQYGIQAGRLCAAYIFIQILNLKFLQYTVTRKVEESIGRQ